MLPQSTPSITRLSKLISAVLVLLFIAHLIVPTTKQYLALVPGRTLPCVWNLITAGFLTTNIVQLVVEVAGVLLLTRLVEPLYGSKGYLKFLLIVDLLVNVTVFLAVYFIFAASHSLYKDEESSDKLLFMEISGFHGLLAALVVAVKQVMPDHEFKLLGTVRVPVKYCPLLFVTAYTAVCVLLSRKALLPFLYLGTYFGWLYLRFYQQQPDSPVQGDPSEDFKFSGFFPPFCAPPIDAVAVVLGTIFRLRHGPVTKSVLPANAPSLLGTDAIEASRRRERGAKALEERLGQKMAASGQGDVEQPSTPQNS